MPFKSGNKLGGRKHGAVNKKTKQWEVFCAYCLDGGLKKFQKELNKLEGKQFVESFTNLLEFHKPKLSRAELTGKEGEPLIPKEDLSKFTLEELKIWLALNEKATS